MEENQKKNSGEALTTDEIRAQSHKWNLARDVGLLAHLENFSQSLVNKSQETQKNLNALLDSFEDTSTTINNVTNQFLALQNSQFVENRVYDDESPAEEPKNNKTCHEEQESYLLARYKEAVEIGVKLLDSHFEEVQLPPNSDSDEEEISTENSGLVWKPKNPYLGKRFPLLIGSAEWWADDNVGLGEYEENINHETPSSESESDMEAEDTAEKRIRMSSSSSTESEKVLSKKPKAENRELDDIFAPIGNDMFKVQSNLFKHDVDDDEDNDLGKSQIVPWPRDNIEPLKLPSIQGEEHNQISKSLPTKKNKSSIFDDYGNSDNEEEYGPESAPVNNQNRLQNALTKELTAKLSGVSSNKDEPKPAKSESPQKNNYEPSALFAENDDSDDLFSAKNSASNFLFKKQSIFSDGNPDDELFGNTGNGISGNKPKITVKISSEQPSDSNSIKDNKNSNLFDESSKFSEDDLFANNDDFLFAGKSVLSSSRNSGVAGPEWKGSREVKFSTPTEQRENQEVPHGDIFGGVSEIRSNGSSNVASVSAISNDVDNSFNFSRYLSGEISKDDGFVEPSDASNNKSIKSDSSGLFEPRLTSTRHIPSDTSDYKTQRISSTRPSQSNSTKSEDNSKSRMGHSEKVHFPRNQSDRNKNKSLFEEEDNEDDLFQSSKPSKPVKENSLFEDKETNDLFGNIPSRDNKSLPIFDEEENSVLFNKSSVPPLDGEEEEKSSLLDKVKQDSISMSSSRSSLFDDVNMGGKTNLASVFENDKSAKISDDLFGKIGDDLFGDKKVVTFDENDGDDLFIDGAISKAKVSDKESLFYSLEEADDLFADKVSNQLFGNYEDDGDLFSKTSANNKVKEQFTQPITTTEHNYKCETSKASPTKKTEPIQLVSAVREESDNIFDDIFDKSEQMLKPNDRNILVFDGEKKSRLSAVTSIFGDLEDEDEDLFGSAKSSLKADKSDNQSHIIFQSGSEVDMLKVAPPKKKNTDNMAVKDKEKMIPSSDELFDKAQIQNVKNSEKTNESDISDYEPNSTVNEKKDFKTTKSKVLENKKLFEVNDSEDNNLFNNASTEESKLTREKNESGIRPSPPKTLNIAKGFDLGCKQPSNVSETDGSVISTEKAKVIGKLSIPSTLKINPMNLLPGATMKKAAAIEDVEVNQSDGHREDEGWKENSEPTQVTSNLLKCLSKDRVKIQTRRRPPTRRARQEALRSSGVDFHVSSPEMGSAAARSRSVDNFEKEDKLPPKSNSYTNVNDSGLADSFRDSSTKILENADSSNSIFHSVENSPEPLFSSPLISKPLSPSTDEEDYFNVPELDTNFEREDQSIFKSGITDFTNDDTLLFDGAPVLSPMNPTKNLIISSDKSEKQEEKKHLAVNQSVIPAPGGIIKSSLIIKDEDDGNDDESLFKASVTNMPGNIPQKKAEFKSKTSNIFDDLEEGDSFLFEKRTADVFGGKVPKKSLFDENDEDDDLFSDKPVTSSSGVRTANDSTVKNKVHKVNIVEKSKETFVDPLGLMTNPD